METSTNYLFPIIMKNKIFILVFYLLYFTIAKSSNFEIKVAVNLNDCVKCNGYLYSLNNISNKYKITFLLSSTMVEDSLYIMEEIVGSKIKNFKVLISDSLYKLYSNTSQNYFTAFKNNNKILGSLLRNIDSRVDTLNELSFENGDSIQLDFKPDIRFKSIIKNNLLYLLNPQKNNLIVTNLVNSTSFGLSLNEQLLVDIYKKSFNGSTENLSIAENYFKSVNQKLPFKISSFFVGDKSLYLMVYSEYLKDTMIDSRLDTVILPIIALLVYNKGAVSPIIYPLSTKLLNNEYSFSQFEFSVLENYLYVNVLKNKIILKDNNHKWICKCKLDDMLYLDTNNCINIPKIHNELELGNNYSEYKLNGDYLINKITNELINYKTKKSKELKIPFNKIILSKTNGFDDEIRFIIVDMKINHNIVELLVFEDSSYKYISYNILTDKMINKFEIYKDIKLLKSAPQFFSNNLFYIVPKAKNLIIIKDIKPI